jgi:DNA anti-recombination protein RmuC
MTSLDRKLEQLETTVAEDVQKARDKLEQAEASSEQTRKALENQAPIRRNF